MQNKRKLEWIWSGRIPRSYITVLAAEGGIGKSGLALYLANKFTAEGLKVVYVDAESCTTHITERFKSWNLSHADDIYFTGKKRLDGDHSTGSFGELASLIRILAEAKPDVVILDSLTALGNAYDLNKATNVATLYTALEELTEFGNAAVLLIAHLRKPQQDSDIELRNSNISGSGSIVNLARSVLMMQRDTIADDVRLLRHTKCNMAKESEDLYIKIDPSTGRFLSFNTAPPRTQFIPSGSKMDQIKFKALKYLNQQDMTKKKLAELLKDKCSASNTELTRLYKWLNTEQRIKI